MQGRQVQALPHIPSNASWARAIAPNSDRSDGRKDKHLHLWCNLLGAQWPDCRSLLFDLRLVTGIDSSATHSSTQIKQAVDARGANLVLVNLSTALASAFGNAGFLTRDVLAEQGGPADSMHFVLEGRDGILVDLGEGRSIRVRRLGRHTTVGEMGLITRRPRSATVQAEAAAVAYELPAAACRRLKEEQPAPAQVLLIHVIGVLQR